MTATVSTEDDTLDVVTEGAPTPCRRGTIFRMEPGKRVVLGQYDQWEKNDTEHWDAQVARVSLTPEEQERRRLGALRLQERLSPIPWYAEAAKSDGEGYWEKLYASRINE